MASSNAVPTWFGPEDRPLFGWVHVPDRPGGQGVVLCPSIGLEGEASQLAFRTLASTLADAGCAVLRFDYRGTGDSAGYMTDPDRLDEWLDDIAIGIGYLRAAGARRIHLVGARMGGALAARAASNDGNIESLTLWYPWTKGSQFLRYQRALRRLYAVGSSRDAGDGSTEIPGFVLDPAVTAEVAAINTEDPGVTFPASVLVIDAADPGTGAVTRPAFAPEASIRKAGGGSDDLFGVELMRATVSEEDVDWVQSFILSHRVDGSPVAITPAIRQEARVAAPDGVDVVERPVFFGESGLFGVLAEPGSAAPPQERTRVQTTGGPVPAYAAAVFLNAGSLHHVGPGRQWVELSRSWAAAGMRCLRIDIGGIGDSPSHGPAGVLSSYPPTAVDDIDAAVQFVASGDPTRVLLLGLCAGAYHSLLAAVPTGVGGVAVLNPLRLPTADQAPDSVGSLIEGAPGGGWASPDEERERVAAAAVQRRRFLGSLRDRGVFTPLAERMPDRVWWAMRQRAGDDADPVGAIRRVVDAGVTLCIVLGPDEWRGIGRGRMHELRGVARSGIFAITYVPSLDHSFHVADGRKVALAVLDEWVLGIEPAETDRTLGVMTIS